MARISYREAIQQALSEEMKRDGRVFLMGEEVAQFQGSYKVTENLLEEFGSRRVIDTPISEAGFAGIGVGAAMMGLRPVIEFMFWSFTYVAFDQVFNNAANLRYMSGGLINVPLVIRGPANGGTGVGATHSQTPENFIANTPGLKVVCPATPYDVKGMMKSAIRDNDPVCVMENTLLYNEQGEVPADEYVIPLGLADIKRKGTDISLIAHGRSVITCLKAAEILESEDEINAEVVDLRSLRPLDTDTIIESVKKTNRVVLVEENKPFCGIDAQIAFMIQDRAFDWLDAPVKRVSSIDAPQIYSMPLEKLQIPDAQRVARTAREII